MFPIIIAIIAFGSTLAGGIFTFKLATKLHYIMSFAAGVLLGIIFFDVVPKIHELVKVNNFSITEAMIALVAGFMFFHIVEKVVMLHSGHEEEYDKHSHPMVGKLSATGLICHSFMDGVGIGIGFLISNTIGILVSIAIISHDFCDGSNTVSLMLNRKNTIKSSWLFLIFDALAPLLGVLSTMLFVVSPHFLVLYLAWFAGFLLYICASDVLPEAHANHNSIGMIGLTIVGIVFIFGITQVI